MPDHLHAFVALDAERVNFFDSAFFSDFINAERMPLSPQPILDCATRGRKILSANVAGRRRVRACF
jgi:hypothetical protein